MFSSDLDVGKTDQHGWRNIFSTGSSRLACHVVKVGHHGSSTAFHIPSWDAFGNGVKKPISVITPFPLKEGSLPKKEMLEEISQRSDRLFVTAKGRPHAKVGKLSRRKSPFTSYQPVPVMDLPRVGQVRIRLTASNPTPQIDLFGDAPFEV
jgi:hypothetical protein